MGLYRLLYFPFHRIEQTLVGYGLPITGTGAAAFPSSVMRRFLRVLPLVVMMVGLCFLLGASRAEAGKDGENFNDNEQISIHDVAPDHRGGRAYKLVYVIQAPLDVYWRFKTDFDNDFLVNNEYIREHRFISRKGEIVLTEDKYASAPDVFFRWQTTVFSEGHHLDFVLLNPKECGEKSHYGSIRAEAMDKGTRVTQVGYLDFWGVSLWAANPWRGGMKDFLTYMARWEQETVARLKGRYSGNGLGKDGKNR